MKREKICSYVLVLAVALASVCPTQANAGEGAAKAVSWQAAGAASVRVVTVNAGKIKNLAVNSGSSVKLKLAGVKGSGKTTWSVSDGCTRLKKKYRKSATIKAVSFGTAIITAKNGKNTWKARVCVQEETKDIESFSESLVSLITSRSGGDGSRGSSGIAVADAEFFSARLLVKSTKTNAQFAAYAPTAVLKGEDGVFVLQFATASRAKKALAKIKKRKDVVWAEPDMLVGGGADQADSELPACDTRETEDRIDQADSELPVCDTIESVGDAENKTAGLASYSLSWGVERMGADVLAPTLSGSVTVAVIDTGVSAHQFLSGLLVQGYDFVSGDADPSDEHFHGTHVAGTVADVAAGHVKIMPLRVLDASGYGYTSTIGLALRYAADHGAGVANLSLSGGHSDYVDQSATYAIAKGVTVVAAAGNDNSDTAYYCPA
ncbi:MAG: S8 family serine peptidase, partial [Lachnospiraceae bacterium]|nr:S8 family serine peptidase [Lachnospiraceae bacterium]